MKTQNLKPLFFVLLILFSSTSLKSQNEKPIRLAVAGMTHGHISFILGRPVKGDFELVGVFDTNKELTKRLSDRYKFSPDLIYHDLEQMLDKVKPEAVVAFGSIYDHLAVVEACAPRGIHVMVEKPLAVNMKHANRMAELAEKHHIFLLTNFETSWYPTTDKSFRMVTQDNFVGNLRKVVFHHGHEGPREIGCEQVFLEWLTDPVLNGGGALVDFGCYGANLIICLTNGEKPLSVTAVTRQFKPKIYPRVDDDATIIISYPEIQCIIQASWNWPFGRKDMEIYGDKGYIFALNRTDLKYRERGMDNEEQEKILTGEDAIYEDPFTYFAHVIHKKVILPEYGLYALKNNIEVVRILDAARESAKTGKTVIINYSIP